MYHDYFLGRCLLCGRPLGGCTIRKECTCHSPPPPPASSAKTLVGCGIASPTSNPHPNRMGIFY